MTFQLNEILCSHGKDGIEMYFESDMVGML